MINVKKRLSTNMLAVILVTLLSTLNANAGESIMEKTAKKYYEELVPASEKKVYTNLLTASGEKTAGKVKTEDVTSYRWQPKSQLALGEDYISVVMNQKEELVGFARMTPNAYNGSLPNKDRTKEIAENFLSQYAPDLLPVLKLEWIGTHDETFKINGKENLIRGMKVKCRSKSDGTYFWVVVSADNSVIIFERDIEWDFIKAGRQTEKWLHDSWLKSKKIEFHPLL